MVRQYASLKEEIDEAKKKAGIDALEEKLETLTSNIKDVARSVDESAIESAHSGRFKVRVDRPFKSWFDLEAIRKFAKKPELAIIEKEALKIEVDKPKFEELVKAGFISREVRQKAFREEEMTPRVVIVEDKEK